MPGLKQAPGGQTDKLQQQDAFLLQRSGTDRWAERQDMLAMPDGWVASCPTGKQEKILALSDFNSKPDLVNAAITYADDNGGGAVVISEGLLPYDASQVTFRDTVRVFRTGQDQTEFDVRAYGAVGNNGGGQDEHAAFQACADHARNYRIQQFGRNSRWVINVPAPRNGIVYELGAEWHLWGQSIEVKGAGLYTGSIRPHSSFDPSANTSLVRIGRGGRNLGDPDLNTSSIYVHDLDISCKSYEANALTLHYWYSGFVRNVRAVAGEYNRDGLGRETGGLHVRGGKNLFVEQCQMATHGAYGVLVDDYGDAGNNMNNPFVIRECLISESAAGIVARNGAFNFKIINNTIGAIGAGHNQDPANHLIWLQGGAYDGATIAQNTFVGATYGVYLGDSTKVRQVVDGNRFTGIDRQAIIQNNRSFKLWIRNNNFSQCGQEHVDGGAKEQDYRTTDHVADIHIGQAFETRLVVQGNVHDIRANRTQTDRLAGIFGLDGFSDWGSRNFHYFADNAMWDGGYYQPFNKALLDSGDTYYHDGNRVLINGLSSVSAGQGGTPDPANWSRGHVVRNEDDGNVFLLDDQDNWIGLNIPPESSSFPGWEGYLGWYDLPVDNPANVEYVLISKLGVDDGRQRMEGELHHGRTPGSGAAHFSTIEVYYQSSGGGGDPNLSVRYRTGENQPNEVRPVAVDWNGNRWAAVEVVSGFSTHSVRAFEPRFTSNYDPSTIEVKEAASVSNVTTARNDGTLNQSIHEEYAARKIVNSDLKATGALKAGSNFDNAEAGMIRWTGTDFEGYDGSSWVSLTP